MALRKWTRIHGSVTGNQTRYTGGFEWQVTNSDADRIANNRSVLLIRMWGSTKEPQYSSYNLYDRTSYITIDGTQYTQITRHDLRKASANQIYYVGLDTTVFPKGEYKEVVIQHESDGTKKVNIETFFRAETSSLTSIKTTSTITLPTIPRTSSITNNTSTNNRIDIGQDVTFTIDRKSSGFTHKLSYVVGGVTYIIGTGIGTSSTYSFPTSLINSFTGTTLPNITVKCETYSGSTKIGENSTTVYLKVPSSYVPSCSLAIEDINTITKEWGLWVKDRSILKGTITASGVAGSTISSYSTSLEGNTYSDNTFQKTLSIKGANSIVSTVTDSRGRKKTDTKNITVLDYDKPTFISISVQRCNSNGVLDEEGTYGKVVCNYSISSLNNNNAKILKVKQGTTTRTFTLTNYAGTITATTAQLFSGLATNTSYNFEFELTDSFETISQIFTILPSYTLMSKRAGGKGITFGRVAEKDGFNVYMDSEFYGELKLNGEQLGALDFDKIYPIGAIYQSNASTSPATLFGGTWVQLTNRFLIGAGGTYSNGSTGGNANLQTHSHTFSFTTSTRSLIGTSPNSFFYGGTDSSATNGIVTLTKTSDRQYQATGTHTNSWQKLSIDASHNHTGSGTTGNQGSGNAQNIPPYRGVYMWYRSA